MAVCQNLVALVNIKIAGKWMFIPLKIVLIGMIHTQIRKVGKTNDRRQASKKKALVDAVGVMEGTWSMDGF